MIGRGARGARGALAALSVILVGFAAPASARLGALAHAPVPRIVNGLTTADYPTTGVLLVGNPGLRFLTCSGTLIGCETFLTAGHCLCSSSGADCLGADAPDPASYFVYLQNGGIYGVTSIDLRADFDFPVGDVAVLHLSSPVTGIAPTPLDTTGPVPGTGGTIVGFGRTGGPHNDYGIKRYGAIATAACDLGISDTTSVCWNFDDPLGAPGVDSNTCNGDSGGSLFIDYGSGPTVAGVTSGGFTSNCLPDDLGFDANVSNYSGWIQTQGGADLSNTTCGSIPQIGDPDAQVIAFDGQVSAGVVEETHSFQVGPGIGLLRVTMNGVDTVENDFDLYVRAGSPPTTSQYDCVDATASQFASCEFTAPVPGTWYLSVRRFSGQGDYQATVSIFGPDCSNPLNAGKPCADRNPCTQSETCQSGTCVGTPVADGTSCDDGNPCTRPDTCQAGTCVNDSTPLSTCRSSDKALLLLNDKGANNDKLVWKWLKGQATSMADFGDPTSSTDYTLCLYAGYAGTAAALVADAAIPASSTHWSSLGDKGYRYNDPTRSAAGIQTALLRGSDKDAAKIVLKGKGAGLPDPTLSLALPVKIQLVRTDNDGCWQSDFDVGDVLRNDSEQFKAKVK